MTVQGQGSRAETQPASLVRRFGPPTLIVVMATAAIILALPMLDAGSATVARPRIPLFVLVGCWAAFELVVLYLPFGKNLDNSVHLKVTEIALALGLLLATPLDLILASVGTPVLIDLLRRRKSPLKQVFNGVSRALGVGIALSLYAAFELPEPLSAQGWMALCLAVTASALASALGGASVISLAVGRLPPVRDFLSHVRWAVTVALLGATISFVVALALQTGTAAVAPLLMSLGALLIVMRGYSLLTERHMNLASLHTLGQRLAWKRDVDSILTTALDTSADLLIAHDAEIYLHSPFDRTQLLRVSKGPGGGLVHTPVPDRSVPLGRGVMKDPGLVVSAAPLTVGREVVLSVSGRSDAMRPFGPADARLLDMVAHQTGANLDTAHLIEQLRRDALHDPLTGLPNRRSVLEKADEHLSRRHPAWLIWVGIRDLQAVNAALGHDRGDELLVAVGLRLQKASGPEAIVGRVGGDEFAILFLEDPDGSLGPEPVRSLLASLEHPFVLSRAQVLVRACAGVSSEPGGSGVGAENLLRHADIAMRSADRAGLAVEYYRPELETATSEHLALAVELQTGITRGELTLYAQPQVRLHDDAVIGVETLLRWNHPRMGLLQPGAFIALAEQTGLDRPMTAWVLNAALEALAGWLGHGLQLDVSVNVSPNALCDGRLRDLVEQLLVLHGVPGQHLVIEVTESVLLTNTTIAAEVLHGLSALGVRVSIDDFGTGFSSLSHLRRLPVDEIKIDQSFVSTMLRDGDDSAIVRSVIGLGRDLGLTCVAEGIEDQDVYRILQRLGCDTGQGYHMARPMPVGDIAAWIASTAPRRWTAPIRVAGGST